jgi:hypothetical protein
MLRRIIIWLFERYAFDLWIQEQEKEAIMKYKFEQATALKFQMNNEIYDEDEIPF